MGICGLGGLWRAIFAHEEDSSIIPSERSHYEQSSFPSEEEALVLSNEVGDHEQSIFSNDVFQHEHSSFGSLTQYDVFLNHRGPDVKKTFVSHLFKALRQVGREPFLDGKALVKGQHALNSINKALNGVLVHIAIFSPRYAESKYCLDELCDMLASQKPMIPVFFNVKPENLRYIEVGPFAEAFCKHLKKGRDQDVMRWKAALTQAAAITGFTLIDCDNDTTKLEEKIVAAVLNTLPMTLPLTLATYAIGLNKPLLHITNILREMGQNVGVIGIYGMGGIGKTTLIKEVYNREQANYNSRSFLKDVKEIKGIAAFEDLRMKMLSDLLRIDAKKFLWNSAVWFDMIRKQKMLLVIDDISEKNQVDELIPNLNNLASGSRILITSRERDVLKSIMLNSPKIQSAMYAMPELDSLNSVNLFSWCAFQKHNINDVDISFRHMAKDIATACCGLPLAIEIMGRFMADKNNLPDDERYWKDAICALRRNGDIISKLQISYDGLVNNEDKRMFLDVACFLLGHSEKLAIEIWQSSGDYGSANWSLRRLIEKCLVKIDENGKLSMHDLLRDMGRNIVIQRASYKLEMQSHIWDSTTAAKILTKKQDLNEILALSIVGANTGITCEAASYAKMREIRYLILDKCLVKGDFSNWSEELRWLQWRGFPYKKFPSNLKLPNLVVLDFTNGALTHLCDENFELELLYGELRMLILNGCRNLKQLPQCSNEYSKLKYVYLEGCYSLQSLPYSFGNLQELEYLNISKCVHLSALPESIANLLKLKKLFLGGCSTLRELPMLFGQLHSLIEVDFGFCIQLQNLSHNLVALQISKGSIVMDVKV